MPLFVPYVIISVLFKVVNSLVKSGAEGQQLEACPLVYIWHNKLYLGAAHGFAGIIYLLLQVNFYFSILD